MDASCKIQGSIHSFRLVYNMCPELWVHIIFGGSSTLKPDTQCQVLCGILILQRVRVRPKNKKEVKKWLDLEIRQI